MSLPAQERHWPALRETGESPPAPWRAGPKLRSREQRARNLEGARAGAGAGGLQLPTHPAACAECGWLGTPASLPSLANGTQERDLTRILRGQWPYRGGGASLPLTLRSEKPHLKGRAVPSSGGWGDQRQKARRHPRERSPEGPGPREVRAGLRRGRGQGRGLASLWSGF